MVRSCWSLPAIALVLAMAVGSVAMWIGVPLGLIYLASRLSRAADPSAGPYLLVLLGLPVGMAVVGCALGALDRAHARLTGRADPRRRPAAWLRSMRGERTPARAGGVLDTVMVISVALAVVGFGIWFVAFAGSSLPT